MKLSTGLQASHIWSSCVLFSTFHVENMVECVFCVFMTYSRPTVIFYKLQILTIKCNVYMHMYVTDF
jgi:hypothetical protein